MCQNSTDYAACWADTQHRLLQSIKRDISKKVEAKIDDKQFVAEAKPKMSPISRVRQQELLQSCEDASDYFCCDWLTCQQLSNHQQLQRGRKKKEPLMWGFGLFVLWADFCGSRCRRNATEKGIFNNLPRRTVWRHMLLKRGHIQLFQRFLWTPTVSLKMESRATVRVNCLADPSMTGCGLVCKGVFDLITWTGQLS